MTIQPADSPQDFRHHGPVLVQEAASDSKLIALFPPACPGPTALFGESGPGQAFAPQTPDDIAHPKAGEEGVCLPVRADPGSSPKTRP